MAVKSVKHWNRGSDERVYVKDDRGFESVLYLTGNNWNRAGTWQKQGKFGITDADKAEAEALACVDGNWTNWPAPAASVDNGNGRRRCPDCGYYDCGPNCHTTPGRAVG